MAETGNTELPDSPSCARNREPILLELQRLFADRRNVLEIGSGTGQHAVYFAPRLPHLRWQTSDLKENLPGIRAWLAAEPAPNLEAPLLLDVTGEWPAISVDAVFTANSLHIMGWDCVEAFFHGLPGVLAPGACLAVYGPVRLGGEYTSASNAEFDEWLKARDPRSGIRDLEALDALASAAGLQRTEMIAMPANNYLLVWRQETTNQESVKWKKR